MSDAALTPQLMTDRLTLMKLAELAAQTGALYEPETAAELEITGAAGLDEAEPGHVTFLANPRYTPRVQTTRATAVYLAEGVEAGRDIAILRARDPYLAYTRALRLFHPDSKREPFVHPSAVIDAYDDDASFAEDEQY